MSFVELLAANHHCEEEVMSTIKVQCQCGQRYAFELEAVEGGMPYPVACPTCGADGTAAANDLMAQRGQADTAVAAAPSGGGLRLREATTAPAAQLAAAPPSAKVSGGRPAMLLPGQLERSQAELEARAKIFWGDAPDEVVKFLMRQSISYEDASELVNSYFAERAEALRSSGIGKIISGSAMVCVPIVAWFIFSKVGFLPIKIFAVLVMIGLWGAWRVLRGTIMVVSPRSETGDVADQ